MMDKMLLFFGLFTVKLQLYIDMTIILCDKITYLHAYFFRLRAYMIFKIIDSLHNFQTLETNQRNFWTPTHFLLSLFFNSNCSLIIYFNYTEYSEILVDRIPIFIHCQTFISPEMPIKCTVKFPYKMPIKALKSPIKMPLH